jgi:hypothetical protein
VDHTLRLYSNPFKQSLYLLGTLGFVAIGVVLLRSAKFSTGGLSAVIVLVMACLCIGFFGLGSVVFLYSMARDLLVRRPVLRVDAQGWTYNPALGLHSQQIPWQDVGRVALYQQRLTSSRMLYLVLEARHPDDLPPPSRMHAMTASLYPSMALAVMTVPLNTVFIRASHAKAERLLHSVQAEFSSELHSYGIAVADTIQDM